MKTKLPTPLLECLSDFPVKHLSFSSVMKWHEDPSGFARQYVHKMFEFDTSPSAVVGSSVHFGIQKILEKVLRGEADFIHKPESLKLLQEEALMKFERIVKGKDDDKRVTKINWGKTGSPEKSQLDILTCTRNAIEAVRSFSGVKWIASEVRLDAVNSDILGIPLPVSSVLDSVVVRFVGGVAKDARVIDWKTQASLSDAETPDNLDSWDTNGKRRVQAGTYYLAGKRALEDAGFGDIPLTGVDFVEIHRGKGGASGKTWQILSVEYEAGEQSLCVQMWAEMARRMMLGVFAAWFMPQFFALPINLSSEYGGGDALKSLKEELENPEESLLTQSPSL